MLSDINIRHLDVGQASGITANTPNIGSRCRTPPKRIQVQVISLKTRTDVWSCHIRTLKKLSNVCAEVFLRLIYHANEIARFCASFTI